MFGGLDVLKFSAKPSKDKYQASCDDAILASLLYFLLVLSLNCSVGGSTIKTYM